MKQLLFNGQTLNSCVAASATNSPDFKSSISKEAKASTKKRICKKEREKMVQEGGELLPNGHILLEANGDIVECKFCSRCREWHPLEDYAKCARNADHLQSYCKECRSNYGKERHRKSHELKGEIEPVSIVQGEAIETMLVPSGLQSKLDELDALNASIREEVERYELENKRLQEENAALKRQSSNLDNLTEADIRRVLANNTIMARLLIDTLYGKPGNYQVYVYSEELGRYCLVKPDEKPSFSRQCA